MNMRALSLVLLLAACSSAPSTPAPAAPSAATPTSRVGGSPRAPALEAGQAEAIFAGGCFWCVETAFEPLTGVISVTSGYTGGPEIGPTYEEVSSGDTGHYEAVRVVYDPSRITYARLLEVFVVNIDPTQGNGQFCDFGRQYRSAIFVASAEERALAQAALERAHTQLHEEIATTVLEAAPFWVAEDYHQDFYRTHPARYTSYREGCGRDARLRTLWGAAAGH
jgi:peptide-methionine (S)-S-oxide reductase